LTRVRRHLPTRRIRVIGEHRQRIAAEAMLGENVAREELEGSFCHFLAPKPRPSAIVATTPSANNQVNADTCSPNSNAANPIVKNACSSCTWPTRAMPPSASPLYQAKKPTTCEISVTYANAHQAAAPVCGGLAHVSASANRQRHGQCEDQRPENRRDATEARAQTRARDITDRAGEHGTKHCKVAE